MAKMYQLLEQAQHEMLQLAQTFSNPHVFATPPKISRGENYKGLPYLVLDYPRNFRPDAVFAIRSFFWWGRFFSSTLQLSGDYKNIYKPNLEAAYPAFSKYHIGINPDPWQHHFEPDNYTALEQVPYEEFKKLLHQQEHIKMSAQWPVAAWQEAPDFFIENWKAYTAALLGT